MMQPIWVNIAVEDSLSDSVLRRLLAVSGQRFEVTRSIGWRGFGYLDRSRLRMAQTPPTPRRWCHALWLQAQVRAVATRQITTDAGSVGTFVGRVPSTSSVSCL